jgi:hypothetical protein
LIYRALKTEQGGSSAWKLNSARHAHRSGIGVDAEPAGREGDGEEDYVVGRSRDHRRQRPDHAAMAGCTVTIDEHLNGDISIQYGPYVIAGFELDGERRGRVRKPEKAPASHLPTVTTTATGHVPKSKAAKPRETQTGKITC